MTQGTLLENLLKQMLRINLLFPIEFNQKYKIEIEQFETFKQLK